MAVKLSFKQAHELLIDGGELILLDVREEPEYLSGHAVDAMLLPVDEITEDSASALIPEKETPVMVYCRTGRRSAEAARKLESFGYRNVYGLGGLVGWPYGLV